MPKTRVFADVAAANLRAWWSPGNIPVNRSFRHCSLLTVATCWLVWSGTAWASRWESPESVSGAEESPALADRDPPSDMDFGWLLDDSPAEPIDAGVDGAEDDPYQALDPAPNPPPVPSGGGGGGGGPVPVPEPTAVWCVGGAWLILQRRRHRRRA